MSCSIAWRRAFTDSFCAHSPRRWPTISCKPPFSSCTARADFRSGATVRPWLFTIAARVRLDELRRRYQLPESAGEEELARVEDEQANPDRSGVLDGDVRDRVRAAVSALPESQRVIVHLHRFEGLTFPEIARALGATEGAVKLRAFRAYEKLRVALADIAPEGAA